MARQPILPPKPDDVALAFASALLASGRYNDDFGAAVNAAWTAVPHFYTNRQWYASTIAPMFFVHVTPRPPWWRRLWVRVLKPLGRPRTAESA